MNNNKQEQEQEQVLTVIELNNLIKNVLKENLSGKIKVAGEISNIKISGGHMYLTLKDKESMINVVLWNCDRNKSLKNIKDGDKVVVEGVLNVYPKGGYYNINSYNISVTGVGDIHKDYTMYKDFYNNLGYFSEEIKKCLPTDLTNIGVITALEGAALKDFLYVLDKGSFKGDVYIKNGVVQGKECPKSIVECISQLDTMNLDVIVVTRGGGSFEDLMGFSHPDIIEGIHNAKTCVISAIGHEVDHMLSDFVADIRAPTPSVAAEMVVKNQYCIYSASYYNNIIDTCYDIIKEEINKYEYKLCNIEAKIVDGNKIALNYLNQLDNDLLNIQNMLRNKVNNLFNKCDTFTTVVDRNNPEKVLQMGYCMMTDNKNNKISTKAEYLKNNDKKLKIIFIDGNVNL